MRRLFFFDAYAPFALFFCFWLCLTSGDAFGGQGVSPKSAIDKSRSHSEGVVAHCFDGDTLKLTDRRIIRLAGINSPEIAHHGSKAQYFAREARQELVRLAQGQRVRLVEVATNGDKDAYGRIVADVRLSDGRSLSALLIQRGAAYFYPHKDQNTDFQRELLELQRKSVIERAGLWARMLSLPLALNNYIGNQASLRFFPTDCPEAERIKPRNRIYFGTLMDAFLAGYAPAGVCGFWPEAP